METSFRLGDWEVYPRLNRLERDGKAQHLEPKAMDLLVYLARHPGEVHSREQLLQAIWPDAFVTDQVLTHAIAEIRRILGDDPAAPAFIETVPRRGYLLIAAVTRELADASTDAACLGSENDPSVKQVPEATSASKTFHVSILGVLIFGLILGAGLTAFIVWSLPPKAFCRWSALE